MCRYELCSCISPGSAVACFCGHRGCLQALEGVAATAPLLALQLLACFCNHCSSQLLSWQCRHLPVSSSIAFACLVLQALQLDFYGDAVVEAWRGTQHGEPHSRCQDAPDIFDAHFGRDFESHVWGVAGPLVSCMHCSCKASLEMNTAMKAGHTNSSCAACLLMLHFSKRLHIL